MHLPTSGPADVGKFASLIQKLSDANSETRKNAATELFQRGVDLAHDATSAWFLDSDLASYFLPGETGTPRTVVGIAVTCASFERIRAANGGPRLANVPNDQDAQEFEIEFPGGIQLDILTTKYEGADGAIDKFLQKFGEGIQQIEFETRDVDRATEILRTRFGITAIYAQTREGANGSRVNFFLVPAEGKKVLIELVETPS